jgi:hypothetical protein
MTAVEQRSGPDIVDVEHGHRELLACYAAALADASRQRRYLARKLVESHIKRRLESLAAIYTQTALVEPDRERYEALASDARAFADTLSMWRLATWLAFFPISLALIGPLVGLAKGVSFDGWHLDSGDVVLVLLSAAFLVVYVGGLLPRAFWRKRALLFPGPERNAYSCEDAAFFALGRTKRKEMRWDYAIAGMAAGLLLLFGPILGILVGLAFWSDAEDIPVPLILAGYIPGGFALRWVVRHSKQREWR